jgi:hypothetical protein
MPTVTGFTPGLLRLTNPVVPTLTDGLLILRGVLLDPIAPDALLKFKVPALTMPVLDPLIAPAPEAVRVTVEVLPLPTVLPAPTVMLVPVNEISFPVMLPPVIMLLDGDVNVRPFDVTTLEIVKGFVPVFFIKACPLVVTERVPETFN